MQKGNKLVLVKNYCPLINVTLKLRKTRMPAAKTDQYTYKLFETLYSQHVNRIIINCTPQSQDWFFKALSLKAP